MWKYKIGTVVRQKDHSSLGWGDIRRPMFGHVIGFANNGFGETILEIRWEDETTAITHPANVLTEGDTE